MFLPLVAISLLGVILLALYSAVRSRNWARFSMQALALVFYAYLIHRLLGSSFDVTPKGPEDTKFLALAATLYACMLLGMLAEGLYSYLDRPRRHRILDWGSLLKPLLLSPMVFIPLLASLQNANVDLARLDAARLMLFLVAFESGFLWKGYLARRASESAGDQAHAAAAGRPK